MIRTNRPAPRTTRLSPLAGRQLRGACAALAFGCGLWHSTAPAADWRDAHPYALIGVVHDTNILRVSDEDELGLPVDADDSADSYSMLEAGFNTELASNRQRFMLDGRVFRNAYNTLSNLDHSGGDGRAQWVWNEGGRWSGDLGYVFNQRMRDFSNQIVPVRDIRKENRRFGSVDRWLGERVQLNVRGSVADINYDENDILDLERRSGAIGFTYVTSLDNTIGLQTEYIEGRFAEGPVRDYTEVRTGPSIGWQMTDRTRIDADAGYTRREHESPTRPDYSGFTGRMTMLRGDANANSLSLSVYRDVSSLGDEIANYAVIDGISVEPTWRLASRTSLRFSASHEIRDFKGERDGAIANADLGVREDRVTTAGIWVDWDVSGAVALSLGYNAEQRSSSRELRDFDYQSIQLQFRAGL